MLGSAIVYSGFVITMAGLILSIKPIERLHVTSRSQGLVIVGINLTDQDKSMDEIRKFVQRYQITYPIALDRDQEAQRAFAMFAIPVSYFIDSSGRIRYTRTTVVTRTDIEHVLQELTP